MGPKLPMNWWGINSMWYVDMPWSLVRTDCRWFFPFTGSLFNFQHEEMWPFAGDNLTTFTSRGRFQFQNSTNRFTKFLGTNETPSFHAQAMISRRWLADGRAEKCGSKFVATFTWILINLGPLLSTSILQSSISQFCLSMWCWGGHNLPDHS